jgi:hypothetical protein
MKTREEIITSMCYTYRHDYGLDRHPDDADFVAGMTGSQRKTLWNQMAQIFDNNIWPHMGFRDEDDWK